MLPQTGEVVMKWLPYVGIAIILIVILLIFAKRKKGNEEESATKEPLNKIDEQNNKDQHNKE